MKILLTLFFLLFSSSVFAEDYLKSKFTIEGIGLGDSSLNFFTKEEIEQSIQSYYGYIPDKKFIDYEVYTPSSFKTYDALQISIKPNDDKYMVYAVDGMLRIEDINICDKKIEEVGEQISKQFIDAQEVIQEKSKHQGDSSGRSTTWGIAFLLNDDSSISVRCYDWHKDTGFIDSFRVSLRSFELNEWLRGE